MSPTIVLIILVILLLGGGGYWGHQRWGSVGGSGIGFGGILLVLFVCYLLGLFR